MLVETGPGRRLSSGIIPDKSLQIFYGRAVIIKLLIYYLYYNYEAYFFPLKIIIRFRDPSLRRPLLMSPESKESGSSSSLPRDIAFRICALRETFEESGILLHTKLTDGTTSNKIPEQDLMKWRPLVHDGMTSELFYIILNITFLFKD